MADATLTVTVENNPFMDGTEPFKIILDWMSADDGSVSKAICATYAAQETARTACPVVPKKIRGGLLSAEFIPGALGVLATDPPQIYTIRPFLTHTALIYLEVLGVMNLDR
jgi:hypothetical protein